MIKQFIRNFISNLLAMTMVILFCLVLVGGLYLINILFGVVGVIIGIAVIFLVWIASMTYSETKREIEEDHK